MEIIINNQTKTETLKSKFQEIYPFLKLEFFTTVHSPGKATPDRFKIGYDRRIGQNSETGVKKEFVIHPDMTIADLEQGIEKLFGIGLQVLRKSRVAGNGRHRRLDHPGAEHGGATSFPLCST